MFEWAHIAITMIDAPLFIENCVFEHITERFILSDNYVEIRMGFFYDSILFKSGIEANHLYIDQSIFHETVLAHYSDDEAYVLFTRTQTISNKR